MLSRSIIRKSKTQRENGFYFQVLRLPSSILCIRCQPIRSYTALNNYVDEDLEDIDALIKLQSVNLSYPKKNDHLSNVNLSIQTPSKLKSDLSTGHALLSKNGYGKTLLSSAISHYDNDKTRNPYITHGGIEYNQRWYKSYVSKVSFQSHLDLLSDIKNTTVYRALTPNGGRLSKSAQYLVVRFGIYPLLHSPIHSISTGEIRKVLLIKSLSSFPSPKLLVLDNAFDGLDIHSRNNLKDLVIKTIHGFKPDMLIQDVVSNVKAMGKIQVMLITHRAEEIVDNINNVTMIRQNDDGRLGLVTQRRNDRTGAQLLHSALSNDEIVNEEDANEWNTIDNSHTWNDSSLPSSQEIQSVLHRNKSNDESTTSPMIQMNDLKVQKGDSIPLSYLNWTVQKGQKWLIAGGNGAGKSTLSRLLATAQRSTNDDNHGITEGMLTVQQGINIGWVSTELHMCLTQSSELTKDILQTPFAYSNIFPSNQHKPIMSHDVLITICQWFDIPLTILNKPFCQLSQGEQKMILIASTIVQNQTQLIILDEPCQGLDVYSRKRVLGVMERICSSTDMSFIYITHHMEEVIPSISHVLHLVGGKIGYVGVRDGYDPNAIEEL